MGYKKRVTRHSSKGCKQRLETSDRTEKTQAERVKRFQKKNAMK